MAKQFPEYISKLDTEVFSGSLWSNADENETRNIDVNLSFFNIPYETYKTNKQCQFMWFQTTGIFYVYLNIYNIYMLYG